MYSLKKYNKKPNESQDNSSKSVPSYGRRRRRRSCGLATFFEGDLDYWSNTKKNASLDEKGHGLDLSFLMYQVKFVMSPGCHDR